MTKRLNCIIDGSSDLEDLYSFKNFPIKITCSDNLDPSLDIFADMDWSISKSGHIQLLNLLDPDLIYSNYHSTGVVGKTWDNHHTKFFEFIDQDSYSDILEIGGASGVLSNRFCQTVKSFTWSIVEPSIKMASKDGRINLINGYFEDHLFDKKFDTIVHSHCLEHSYDPVKFLNKINSLLDYGSSQYISIPNMKHWLENGFTNTLSFEHTFYIDDVVLEHLLNKTGFKIVRKVIKNHSIFVKAVKVKDILVADTNFSYIKDLFVKYIHNLTTDVSVITNRVKDSEFYLFGAHMFSLVLLNLKLDDTHLKCILDNDRQKQDKRMYGTNYLVKSPECLAGLESPIVVLRGGVYSEEIKQSILKINSTTVFV